MEKLVSLVRVGLAKVLFVKLLNLGIVVRLTESVALVLRVQSICTELLVGIENIDILIGKEVGTDEGLTTAVDAAAGAAHNLDEGVGRLACTDIVHDGLGILHTVCNGNLDINTAEGEGSFLDAVEATNLVELDGTILLAFEYIVSGTESSLHNTTGNTEDNAGACVGTYEVLIEVLVGELCKVNAGTLDEIAELTGCENAVNISVAVYFHLGTLFLELLCGAGHNGYNEDILGINAVLLSEVGLDDSAFHLVGGLAGGQVINLIAIVVLAVVNPSGRAGGDHGENAVALNSCKKLICLFHDGKVSSEVGIIYSVKAESSESSAHLAGYGSADLHAELFAERSSDSGSGLNNDELAGLLCLVDLGNLALLHESSGGADGNALTAEEAGRIGEGTVACRSYDGCKATVLKAEDTGAVCILAAGYAAAAEDALGGIADDGGRNLVNSYGSLGTLENALTCAGLAGNEKELAVAVLGALLAVLVVVGKKKLNGGSAGLNSLGRGNGDFHTFVYGVNTGSNKASCAGSFYETYTAGAEGALSVVVGAQRGNIVTAASGGFKNGQAFFNLIGLTFDFNVN